MDAPRVFISYSHNSPKYQDRIPALSDRLRQEGVECSIDQYEQSPEVSVGVQLDHRSRATERYSLRAARCIVGNRQRGLQDPCWSALFSAREESREKSDWPIGFDPLHSKWPCAVASFLARVLASLELNGLAGVIGMKSPASHPGQLWDAQTSTSNRRPAFNGSNGDRV
jgi:hypothetical protein